MGINVQLSVPSSASLASPADGERRLSPPVSSVGSGVIITKRLFSRSHLPQTGIDPAGRARNLVALRNYHTSLTDFQPLLRNHPFSYVLSTTEFVIAMPVSLVPRSGAPGEADVNASHHAEYPPASHFWVSHSPTASAVFICRYCITSLDLGHLFASSVSHKDSSSTINFVGAGFSGSLQ